MKWVLTCLSPVHIGTGNVVHPYQFEVQNGRYTVYNLDAALSALAEEDEALVEQYSDYATEILVKGNARGRNGAPLYADGASVVAFCERKLGDRALARRIRNKPGVIAYTAAGVTWRPGRRRREVREQIKCLDQPYLPGSSIKGALRVALAFDILIQLPEDALRLLLDGDRQRNLPGIRRSIEQLKTGYARLEQTLRRTRHWPQEGKDLWKRRNRLVASIGQTVDWFLFRWGTEKKNGVSFVDPQQDLLRALRVSDSLRADAELTIVEVQPLTRSVRSGGGGAPIVLEAIAEESRFEVDLQLDAPLLRSMALAARRDGRKKWIDFDQKFRWVFQREPEELRNMHDPEALRQWGDDVLRELVARTRKHAAAVLEHDRSWARRTATAVPDPDAGVGELARSENKTGVLRLGYASGWHATTVALALKQRGYDTLLNDMLYVFLMDLSQKKQDLLHWGGDPQKILRLLARRPDVAAFPSSRRMVVDQGDPQGWMGWVSCTEGELVGTENAEKGSATGKSTQDNGEQLSMEEKLRQLKQHFQGE